MSNVLTRLPQLTIRSTEFLGSRNVIQMLISKDYKCNRKWELWGLGSTSISAIVYSFLVFFPSRVNVFSPICDCSSYVMYIWFTYIIMHANSWFTALIYRLWGESQVLQFPILFSNDMHVRDHRSMYWNLVKFKLAHAELLEFSTVPFLIGFWLFLVIGHILAFFVPSQASILSSWGHLKSKWLNIDSKLCALQDQKRDGPLI